MVVEADLIAPAAFGVFQDRSFERTHPMLDERFGLFATVDLRGDGSSPNPGGFVEMDEAHLSVVAYQSLISFVLTADAPSQGFGQQSARHHQRPGR